ncbi:hypothetical protein B0A48_12221 [Cryoendolithus antarcticus]|uniref:Uncharacterized protein n=1 Tax=Cryoendolithus antarcticus TaxID=1507870 RepID=A0A1V8SUY8_9PEZI|nr:hypothetical protein B0A48_12221 [Cryoendolithus antarcticus]
MRNPISMQPRSWQLYDRPQGRRGQDDVVIPVCLPTDAPPREILLPSHLSQLQRILKRPYFTALDACAAQDAAVNGIAYASAERSVLESSPSAANTSSRRDSLQGDESCAPPPRKKLKSQQRQSLPNPPIITPALLALSAGANEGLPVLPVVKVAKKSIASSKLPAASLMPGPKSSRSSIASASPAPSSVRNRTSLTPRAESAAPKAATGTEAPSLPQVPSSEAELSRDPDNHDGMIQMYRVRGTWYEVMGGEPEKWLSETKWVLPPPRSSVTGITPGKATFDAPILEVDPIVDSRGETEDGRRKSTRRG